MDEIDCGKNKINKFNKKDAFYLLMYFFLSVLIISIVSEIVILFLPKNIVGYFYNNENFLYELFFYLIMTIMTFRYYIEDIKVGFSNFIKNWKKITIIIILFFIIDSGLESIMDKILYLPVPENQKILNEAFIKYPLFEIITTSLLAPLIEEITFRHILIGKLSTKIPLAIATLFSVFIFAFVHTGFSMEIIQYLPGSIILAILYLINNKNISVTIIYHILWNTSSVIGMLFLLK